MKYAELFVKTCKQLPKDEVSLNAQLLIRGGFVDKLMSGVYTLLPMGLRVYKKVEQIIREEMIAIGGQEVFMPTLQPKDNWVQTGRWETGKEDLYILKLEDGKEFVLGPTHEEVVVPTAKKFINSYRDLPVYLFQFQNKFRNEKRAKSGLLRGREFIMKDLYSFHADEKDLDEYYEKAKKAYVRIFERLGLSDRTYLTYASGGTFSKYSHEFQTLTSAGEDIIHICDKCRVAVNKEIIDELGGKCPECGSSDLRIEKSVEVGNIFKLMNKFSEPFGLSYTDEAGQKKIVLMGCYGIGLQRAIGTIAEVCCDDKGIIWPKEVAPFAAHIVELKSEDLSVKVKAEEVYYTLKGLGAEVLHDDREDTGAGEKFADADLIGCPFRIVISDKTIKEDKVELKLRGEKESKFVTCEELFEYFK